MNEDFVIRLLEAFNSGKATELEIREGSLHILLRKGGASAAPKSAFIIPELNFKRGEHTDIPAADGDADPAAVDSAGNGNDGNDGAVHLGLPGKPANGGDSGAAVITSPIVATFYASSGPDSPPFVSKGSRVKKGGTLCILEAMKMMNHLEAEFDCEILEIRASSGDMVEFGQVLFDVRRI